MSADRAADVVVIGAGVSGLRAASLLHASGHSVVVLEARNRIGGRLDVIEVDGVAFDLGATWFWSNERAVAELVEQAGVEVFPQHLAGDALLQTPDGVQRANGNPVDVPSGRFVAGAGAISSALARRLPSDAIVLDSAVRSIRLQDGGVEISSGTRDWFAQAAVLAVPPALAAHAIEFQPDLSASLMALASSTPVWMGGMAKAVAVYDRPFWRDDGLAGSAISYTGPLREVHDMSARSGRPGALFGFAPADRTLAVDEVVAQLSTLFGAQAAVPEHVELRDWSRESFTSPPGAAAMHDYQNYGHPVFGQPALGDRVVWASTETSRVAPGHIEGALWAGERAADQIRPLLTNDETTDETTTVRSL